MARELSVSLYLFVFRLFFTLFSFYPQKRKTTFVASFGDNVLYTVNELEKHSDEPIVILKTAQCKVDFEFHPDRHVLLFELSRPLEWIRSIFHLATSTHIFVDNYFGFLAAAPFRDNVKCIQLWHAAGAIKQFGLKDPSIKNRSPRALERFQKVYNQFTHVVVGSEKMVEIFKEAFGLSDDRMLRTGIPRTDFFFDQTSIETKERLIEEKYPIIQEKKVILYAPTFRDDALDQADIALDLEKMYEAFNDEYVLFLRLHPAIRAEWNQSFSDFVYDVSHFEDVNHLLTVTDILITDYSSIPFEFALLYQPMIFFAYDLESYEQTRGFWEDYEKLVPGPVVKTTEELITVIEKGEFDYQRIRQFAEEWNEYSNGHSSENAIKALYPTFETER